MFLQIFIDALFTFTVKQNAKLQFFRYVSTKPKRLKIKENYLYNLVELTGTENKLLGLSDNMKIMGSEMECQLKSDRILYCYQEYMLRMQNIKPYEQKEVR